jgi:hypothetical protein
LIWTYLLFKQVNLLFSLCALELCSRGHNQSEIARILQVGVATISRDVHYIQQDLYNKRKEFGEQTFVEYQKSLYGLDQVLKELWESVDAGSNGSSITEKKDASAIANNAVL